MKKNILSKFSKGFTLVELLVVIAIIGILSTLLLLQLNTARSRARDAKRVSDITQIRTALEQYYEEGNVYPVDATLYTDVLLQKYFSTNVVPKDPQGGDYVYHANPTESRYQIMATLENNNAAALGTDADFTGGEWTGAVDGTDSATAFRFDLGIK